MIYKCKDCKYWVPVSESHSVGDCRHGSPGIGPRKRGAIDTGTEFSNCFGTNREWPHTGLTDWCGEFSPRDKWLVCDGSMTLHQASVPILEEFMVKASDRFMKMKESKYGEHFTFKDAANEVIDELKNPDTQS